MAVGLLVKSVITAIAGSIWYNCVPKGRFEWISPSTPVSLHQ